MVILKSRLIFLFFFVFLVLMVFYKIEANYFTPDEIFYLFSDSMLTDVTVASRYKFVAYIFRFIYEYGEYISLLIVNITIVWFVINKLSKSSNNNDVNYLIYGFLFPSVVFYASLFLRDFYVFILAILFVYVRRGKHKLFFQWCIILAIGFLKIELAAIFMCAMFISRIKISPFVIVYMFIICVLTWFLALHNQTLMGIYLNTLERFEPTVFSEYNTLFFGLQQMEPTPLNGAINIIFSYINLLSPFLISWPSNTGNIFNVIMTVDSILFLGCIIIGVLGFNTNKYYSDDLYRLSIFVLLLSIIYGYFMVTPMTSLRMHIHFVPFAILFFMGSRFKICVRRY